MTATVRGERDPIPALLGAAVGLGVFLTSTAGWAVVLLLARDDGDGTVNMIVAWGVPGTWLAGLVVAWLVAPDGPASLAGYLMASAALLVVGAVALARATEGKDWDAGGGGGLLALPMVLIALVEAVTAVILFAIRVLRRVPAGAPPTPPPYAGPAHQR